MNPPAVDNEGEKEILPESISALQSSLEGIDKDHLDVTETVNSTTNPRDVPPNKSQPGTILGASMAGEPDGEGNITGGDGMGGSEKKAEEGEKGEEGRKEEGRNQEGVHVYQPASTPPAGDNNAGDAEVDEAFFEPTLSDVQAHHASVLARSKRLNDAPLQTSKFRDAERAEKERSKADKWPNTTIRVRFSDGTIVERSFPSTSQIQPVYDFVRSTLDASVSTRPFMLWQPPRSQYPEHPVPLAKKAKPINPLNTTKIVTPANYGPVKGSSNVAFQGGTGRNETLSELGLVPQSLLLLKWEEEEMNGSGVAAPLREDLRAKSVPMPPPQTKEEKAAEGGNGGAAGGGEAKKEKKIPKWLQKGLLKKK